MRIAYVNWLTTLFILIFVTGCAFEPVKSGYSKNQVSTTSPNANLPHGSKHSLLVFRTSGFKLWENQDAEVLINGTSVAFFKAGGARYLPLTVGQNSIVVREPEHVLECELEFEFQPGTGQFVEIYERLDPGAMLISLLFADLQSRLAFDPHPGTKCAGVYGLSMGLLKQQKRAKVHKEFSFRVVQR